MRLLTDLEKVIYLFKKETYLLILTDLEKVIYLFKKETYLSIWCLVAINVF